MENRAKPDKSTHQGHLPLRAAIYCRISSDKGGQSAGVDRQEADCRALATRLGWDVVAVFVDNDISAYSGKPRPGYREMVVGVKAGDVQGIVAWHTDRLHRRAVELEEFVTLAEAHDLQVQTVTAGTLDLSTASGRMVARMLGAAAQHEVDHARERMKAAKKQMAADGKYRGGPRPYGFEKDGTTIRPDEARVILAATMAVLEGRSLAAVARELNEAGAQAVRLKRPDGAPRESKERVEVTVPWTYGSLRDVLIRPRNAGLLARGRPEHDDFEVVGPAQWPAIVDEETWRDLHTLLRDPARLLHDGNEPRWLGAGLYRCGLCGSVLRVGQFGGTPSRPAQRKHYYRCIGANHLVVAALYTDEYVRGVVADLVRDPRVVAAMTPDDPDLSVDRDRRTVLTARLASFETDYIAGLITGAQRAKATAVVTAQMEEIDRRLADGIRRSKGSPILAAPDPGAAFLSAPLDVQRAVLAAVLTVEVLPQAVKGAAWSPQRLRLSPV